MKRISMALTSVLLFSSTLIAELSEKEVEVIAEQYADAILKGDYKASQALSYDKNRVSEQDFKNVILFGKSPPEKIRITDVDGLNVSIKISYDGTIFGSPIYRAGWLQLLPDGKIKYDPLIGEHPIVVAFKSYRIGVRCKNKGCNSKANQHDTTCSRKKLLERLKATGIPLFGYDLNASPFDQKATLRKIKAWLKEEGAHWDNSEPKLDCPYKQHKKYVSRI